MPHKQSLRRKENPKRLMYIFKEVSSTSLVIKKSEKKFQQEFWAENLQKHWRDAFLSILKLIHCSKEAFCLLHYKKKRVILQFDIKLNVFGHLDLSPSISSRTLKILENRLLRSLQHVHKNSAMKEIRKIFPQLKRYLVLKLVYKFLLLCFNFKLFNRMCLPT